MRGVIVLGVFCSFVGLVFGHGYIKNPAARNACWQLGFKSCGVEWTMDEKNCGAFSTQWNKNGGKCGVCGDPYHLQVQKYVYPGSHATGTITRTYRKGQVIELELMITVTHRGWSEFRVGDIGQRPITQDKLRYLLPLAGTTETRWSHNQYVKGKGVYKIKLQLPKDLSCEHCVLQWWWKTGNSWGCEMVNGKRKCGMGLGPQETFVNCADISITNSGGPAPTAAPPLPTDAPTPPPPTQAPIPPTQAPIPPTQAPTAAPPSGGCKAIGVWTGNSSMDSWCISNCSAGYCPPEICLCTK